MNELIITQTLNLPNTTPIVTKRFSVSIAEFETAVVREIGLSREAVKETGRTFPSGASIRFNTAELVLRRLLKNRVGAIIYEDADGFTMYAQIKGVLI